MAIDPSLIQGGAVNFDWISKGVKTGMEFAQAKSELEHKKESLEQQRKQTEQQKMLLHFQKASMIYDKIGDIASTEIPSVRRAKLKGFMGQANLLGIQVSPETIAALENEEFSTKVAEAVKFIQTKTPVEIAQSSDWLTQALGSDKFDKLVGEQSDRINAMKKAETEAEKQKAAAEADKSRIGVLERQVGVSEKRAEVDEMRAKAAEEKAKADIERDKAKLEIEAGKAETGKEKSQADIERDRKKLELENKKLDILRLKATMANQKDNSGKISALRKEAQAVEKTFSGVESAPAKIKRLLSQNTAAGDLAATQQIIKLVGDSRIAMGEIKSFEGMGNVLDRTKGFFERNLGSGKKFPDKIRPQLFKIVDEMGKEAVEQKKTVLSSVYNEAESQFPNELRQGRIINPKVLKSLYGIDAKGAPSQKSDKVMDDKTPKVERSAPELNALKGAIMKGSSRAAINMQLKKRGRPPISESEYDDLKGGQ